VYDNIINLIIDSNGSEALPTIKFIAKMNKMKTSKNITFNGYALKAHSSTFYIFQFCNNKYVSPLITLLLHNSITIIDENNTKINTCDYAKYFSKETYEYIFLNL